MTLIETKRMKNKKAETFETHGELNDGDNKRTDKRLKTKREKPAKDNEERIAQINEKH